MKQLIRNLIEDGCLKNLNIIEAFTAIDRKDFVPEYLKEYAYENRPLPIGAGQTISQPAVVAFMLELLRPKQGEKVLDVGFGSGWQTALLAHVVGEKGKVVAIERMPELFDFGKRNCEKYHFNNIEFILGDGNIVYKPDKFFDKIVAGASSPWEIPEAFKKQLRIGGRMVIPIGDSIFSFWRENEDVFLHKEYPGFLFVPLIKD